MNWPSRQKLLELLAGRLSHEEADPLSEHDSTCSICQHQADELTANATVRQFHRQNLDASLPGGAELLVLRARLISRSAAFR